MSAEDWARYCTGLDVAGEGRGSHTGGELAYWDYTRALYVRHPAFCDKLLADREAARGWASRTWRERKAEVIAAYRPLYALMGRWAKDLAAGGSDVFGLADLRQVGKANQALLALSDKDLLKLEQLHTLQAQTAFERSLSGPDPRLSRRSNQVATIYNDMRMVWAASWWGQTCPTIHLTATQAAALALTDLRAAQLRSIRAPWSAFCIAISPPLLNSIWERLYILVDRDRWSLIVDRDQTSSSYRDQPLEELYRTPGGAHVDVECDTQEIFRAAEIQGRVVLNLCYMLGDSSLRPNLVIKGQARRTSSKGKRRKRKGRPLSGSQSFELRLPIEVDLSTKVIQYLRGESTHIHKAQHIRRGHWNNQPYGPRSSLRKRIWRKPTWVNRDGGPTILREMTIKT